MERMNVANSNIPVGVCDQCGVRIRIRTKGKSSVHYRQWMAHIKKVQKTGIGVLVCWPCYGQP